jgi:hypothetical protein
MSDSIEGMGIHAITDKIYEAADKEGVGLAEYIRKTYSKKSLANLERNVRTQLNSLQGEISGFMTDVEVPRIEANLITASKEKLDLMQARVRRSLMSKITELDEMLSTEPANIFSESQEESSILSLSYECPQAEGLLTIE